MKQLILFVLIIFFSFKLHAQIKIDRLFPHQQKHKDIIEDLGNPLKGNSKLIIKTFVEKEGSYLFYLNEDKAKSNSYLSDSPKDLYAGIYLEDHGGILEQITFKDFAGLLTQPKYMLNHCIVFDADKDRSPEFYITYFEESDGLDAKPLKVIVYHKKEKLFIKSKVTVWIPFQPEDKEKIEKDGNFQNLPKLIQDKAQALLYDAKKSLK